MKERMYAMSNIDLEKLAYLRMADQAVELATTKIKYGWAKIMSLGDSLPIEQQEAFKNKLADLENKKRNSTAGLVGYLRHEGIITSEMISLTGRVNIGETNGDNRMQYVEGYQYNQRTIKRWEKARTIPAVVVEVQQDKAPDGLGQGAYETAKNGLVSSDEITYLTSKQIFFREVKDIIDEGTVTPIGEAVGAVGRLFSDKRKDGTKIHRHSLLKRVKGYLEPSLGALDRVIGDRREDGTRIHHQRPLWQIIKDSFFEKKEDLFGRTLAKREENKRYRQMDMERQASLQSAPAVADEDKLNPNPILSLSAKGGQVGQG